MTHKEAKKFGILTTLKQKNVYAYTNQKICLAFSPNNNYLVMGQSNEVNYEMQTWHIDESSELKISESFRFGKSETANRLLFNAQGNLLATANYGRKTLKIWDAAHNFSLITELKHTSIIRSLAFSPCGKYLFTASNTIKIFDLEKCLGEHKETQPILESFEYCNIFNSIVFHPHERLLATSSYKKGYLSIWNFEKVFSNFNSNTDKCKVMIKLIGDESFNGYNLDSLQFSYDGRYLYAIVKDEALMLTWNLTNQSIKPYPIFNYKNGTPFAFAVHPKQYVIATGSHKGNIKIWDLSDINKPKLIFNLENISKSSLGLVNYMTFSPCGNYLAFSTCNGNVSFLNLRFLDKERLDFLK